MSNDCLIVSNAAQAFAWEMASISKEPVSVTACTTVKDALDSYAGETVLFGNPEMIAEVLPQLPNIDWVQSTWAGVTPLIELDRRDYTLTGVKDVFGPQISEYVIGYLLAHELKVLERFDQQRKGNWFATPSGSLHGKHLGVMGTGTIGAHIAHVAKQFGIRVTGLSRSGSPSVDFDDVLPVTELQEFLGDLDYLVSTLPKAPGTDKLLDATAFAELPAHAYLVNVGRGNVVDEEALIAALENDQIAGATLDVFNEEPITTGSPLWHAPNLMITAHIAALSHPALIVPVFLENLRRHREGRALNYVIDFNKGY
jgi:phosphoglycerate dehydrogenase-like enzyme